MKLVPKSKHDDQPNAEVNAIDPAAVTIDALVQPPSATATWKAYPAVGDGEISVQSLEKQHAEAVAAVESLTVRRDQLAADIARLQRVADEFGELSAMGD